MKSPNGNKLTEYILVGLGIIPVILAALTVAPFLSDGLAGIVKGLTHSMNNPINIQWCADSPKAILVFLAAYGTGIGVYFSTLRNYRRGEEHAKSMPKRTAARTLFLPKMSVLGWMAGCTGAILTCW